MRLIWIFCFCLSAALAGETPRMPYEEAGFTAEQAAAHLLARFTFGARPGDVERVAAMGLDVWFSQQLAADQPVPELDRRLAQMPDLRLSNQGLIEKYPHPARIARQLQREGKLRYKGDDAQAMRRMVRTAMREQGAEPQARLIGQLRAQKILRAVYDENQLREMMTEFWFNHFNVSVEDGAARIYVVSYERDVIRPNALGRFEHLLTATAKHPAMLLYLDNALSTAGEGVSTVVDRNDYRRNRRARIGGGQRNRVNRERRGPLANRKGVNENYARELLELHTIGIEGGYTQADVEETARAFTGWTIFPQRGLGERGSHMLARLPGLQRSGDFLFRGDVHDAEAKRILGRYFPAGGGLAEGEQVLTMLAHHPGTARRLAEKLACRFHSDDPPTSLVQRMMQAYRNSRGDISKVLWALVTSPEFWSPDTVGVKVKTPLELLASAGRGLSMEMEPRRPMQQALAEMGQPLYAYAAPTGFPDEAEFWVNAGLLVSRIHLMRDLARGRLVGGTPNLNLLAAYGAEDDPGKAIIDSLLPSGVTSQLTNSLANRPLESPTDVIDMVAQVLASPDFQRR